MKILLLLLITNICYSQGLRLTMEVERVPISTKAPSTTTTEKILLVLHKEDIGLITNTDTLIFNFSHLVCNSVSKKCVKLYIDQYDQLWWIQSKMQKTGIIVFLTPVKPFKRELYAINLKTI